MGSKIKLLSDEVANQIAAGEVVERPASVAKELLENALDAGAGRLFVEVEQGGRRLIKVTDDGEGMSREDALLCLERHATSKIRAGADLFAIRTMGFRGEALPSIASVSEMTISTREREAVAGTRVSISAGAVKNVTEAGLPPGTEIEVRRLFFNVPARRKFLKSVDTELGHITTLIANMALARPDVHFRLTHNGEQLFDLPSSSDLGGRLRQALGADAVVNLAPVDREEDLEPGLRLRVHGFVSVPSYTRSSTRSLHLFVNRRFVRDRLLSHAIFEAYRTVIPRGRFPLVVLFIDLPPEAVDVNVHPAKVEVRFREQSRVHDALITAVQAGLHDKLRPGLNFGPAEDSAEAVPFAPAGFPPPAEKPLSPEEAERANRVTVAVERFAERQLERQRAFFEPERRNWPPSGEPGRSGGPAPNAAFPGVLPTPTPESAPTDLRFSDLRVIGQVAASYILAESDDALYIIDQHAAHERVAFERLRGQYREAAVARQPFLFPVTVELNFQEARRVEKQQETLLRLGLEVEPFGGNTVAVKALPSLLAGKDPTHILLEVVDRLGEGGEADLGPRVDAALSVMACHSVVRANQAMTAAEMEALLQAMDEAIYRGQCPHGRDSVIRFGLTRLEKWFGR